jgi:citrate lyase subunit beta / citryl-CoA lyase
MALLRSYLFAPGNQPKLLDRVFRSGADAVVLDLEDAVPASEKTGARRLVAATLMSQRLSTADEGSGVGPRVFVRMNSTGTDYWRADIDAVIGPGISGIRVPKAESLEAMCRVHDAVSAREHSLGLPKGSIRLVATIETARGLNQVEALATAPRLAGFTFGAADFCADIRADPADPMATLHACSRLVTASRAGRIAPPVGSVFTELQDLEALRVDTERLKRLGFFGRSAIHPRQVEIINAVFQPTVAEVAAAREVVAAYETAERGGSGVTRMGGVFVDVAVVRRARALLGLSERVGRDR